MTVESPDKPTDLAPTDNKTGADKQDDKSLIDVNLDKPKDGQPVDKAASPDTKPDATKADAKPADSVAVVVPEKYADPKMPEGYQLNAEAKTAFDSLAKELKMTQESYQKVFDIYGKQLEADIKGKMDVFNQTIASWKEQSQKELGTNLEASLSMASKGIDKIFSDPKENKEFREMLSEGATGLGNWNLMIKAFAYVGKSISEDNFVDGTRGIPEKKSTAEILYDHPSSVAARKSAGG